LIKGDSRDLIETDYIIKADQATLACRIIDKHLGNGRFAARDQMSIGGYLLEKVALSCAAGPQFHEIIVSLHERYHAQQERIFGPLRE